MAESAQDADRQQFRLQHQLLQNDLAEATRLLKLELSVKKEEAAKQEARQKVAQNSLAKAEADYESLRQELRQQMREIRSRSKWLQFSRQLLERGVPVSHDAQNRESEERIAVLRARKEQLQKSLQALGSLSDLHAEVQDLESGAIQWKARLLALEKDKLDQVPLLDAEKTFLRQQAELEAYRRTNEVIVLPPPRLAVSQQVAKSSAPSATRPPSSPVPSCAHTPRQSLGPPASPSNPSRLTPSPARAVQGSIPRPKVKAPPPPPPKAGAKAKAMGPPPRLGKASSVDAVPKSNGLLNIMWKPAAPLRPEDLDPSNDSFLGPIRQILGSKARSLDLTESLFKGPSTEAIPELSPDEIKRWFTLRTTQTSLKLTATLSDAGDSQGAGRASDTTQTVAHRGQISNEISGFAKQTLLDSRAVRSAGLLIQRFRMGRGPATSTLTGHAATALLAELCKAFLQCRLQQEALQSLQDVLESHQEAGAPVTAFVQQYGIDALRNCDPEAEHLLVHMVSSIPAYKERLRCLAFQGSWAETAKKCRQDLEVLQTGLQALESKKLSLAMFCQTAMKLGNMLNEAGGGQVATFGFRLSSLPAILQLKCPSRPQLLLVHFIVALLAPQEAADISTDLTQLAAARDRKSSGVHERCRELIQGFATTSRLASNVPRKMRRRLTIDGRGAANMGFEGNDDFEPDPIDAFGTQLSRFLENHRQEAAAIADLCFDVFDRYREFAEFFGDPAAFYPPPKRDTDSAEDLFLVFHRLGEAVAKGIQEVKSLKLREELQAAQEGGPEAALAFAASLASFGGSSFLTGAKRKAALEQAASEERRTASKGDEGTSATTASPSKAVATEQVLLTTPPTSPVKGARKSAVATVASPTRKRDMPEVGISPERRRSNLVKRLLHTRSSIGEEEAQSDVSDWDGTPARRPATEASPVVTGRESDAADDVKRRRRRMLPQAPPTIAPSPTPSSASRTSTPPPSTNEATLLTSPTPPSRRVTRQRGSMTKARESFLSATSSKPNDMNCNDCHQQDVRDCLTIEDFAKAEQGDIDDLAAPMTPPGSPKENESMRKPDLRMSLSAHADRVTSAALCKLYGDSDTPGIRDQADDDEGEFLCAFSAKEDDSPTWVSCATSRCSSAVSSTDRSRSRGGLQRPPMLPDKALDLQAHTSFTSELQAEVRRRSLSRDSFTALKTPKTGGLPQHHYLSPVAEPGETPTHSSDRGSGVVFPPAPPLPFARSQSSFGSARSRASSRPRQTWLGFSGRATPSPSVSPNSSPSPEPRNVVARNSNTAPNPRRLWPF